MANMPGGGGTRSSVDIPFDLNKIFSLTYEFQPLKEVLEHIFGQLSKQASGLSKLEDRISDRFDKYVNLLRFKYGFFIM